MTTSFESIVGNDAIKSYFSKLLEKGCIPHSLLFAGPEGVGKTLFAEAFARRIVGTEQTIHPDIHHFRPEGKTGMHALHTVKEFCQAVYLAPLKSKKKVLIVSDAHRMLPSSSNALLKTFEEPALDSIIILISHESEKLLPTVISRCQRVQFLPLASDSISKFLIEKKNINPKEASRIARCARGSIGQALSSCDAKSEPLKEMLFDALSKGLLRSYCHCIAFTKKVCGLIESRLKKEEEILSSGWNRAFLDKPNAVQRERIEKDIDGAATLMRFSLARQLFDALLSWERDLQLLAACGDSTFLFNPDYEEQLVHSLQSGNLLSLEKVEQAVAEAILSLERSTSLHLCLENLLLKLMR